MPRVPGIDSNSATTLTRVMMTKKKIPVIYNITYNITYILYT